MGRCFTLHLLPLLDRLFLPLAANRCWIPGTPLFLFPLTLFRLFTPVAAPRHREIISRQNNLYPLTECTGEGTYRATFEQLSRGVARDTEGPERL